NGGSHGSLWGKRGDGGEHNRDGRGGEICLPCAACRAVGGGVPSRRMQDLADIVRLPTAADVDAAAQRLKGVALHTPLVGSPVLDALTGGPGVLQYQTTPRHRPRPARRGPATR